MLLNDLAPREEHSACKSGDNTARFWICGNGTVPMLVGKRIVAPGSLAKSAHLLFEVSQADKADGADFIQVLEAQRARPQPLDGALEDQPPKG